MPFGELDIERIAALEPDLISGVYSGITEDEYVRLSEIAPTITQTGGYVDFGMPWQEMTSGRVVPIGGDADDALQSSTVLSLPSMLDGLVPVLEATRTGQNALPTRGPTHRGPPRTSSRRGRPPPSTATPRRRWPTGCVGPRGGRGAGSLPRSRARVRLRRVECHGHRGAGAA